METLLANALIKQNLLEKSYSGKYPLHQTVELGYVNMFVQLLNAGASLICQDKFKRTVLHLAAIKKNHVITKLIIEKNSQMHYTLDRYQRRPSDYAVAEKINANTSIKKTMINELEIIDCFVTPLTQQDFWHKDSYGKTILHHAISGLSIHALKKLLEGKAKSIINVVDNYGKTALHEACVLGLAEEARLLLQFGIDATIMSQQQRTAFEEACININIGTEKAQNIFKGYNYINSSSMENSSIGGTVNTSFFNHAYMPRLQTSTNYDENNTQDFIEDNESVEFYDSSKYLTSRLIR